MNNNNNKIPNLNKKIRIKKEKPLSDLVLSLNKKRKKQAKKVKKFEIYEEKIPKRIGFDLDGVLAHSTMSRGKFKMFQYYKTCRPVRVDLSQMTQIENDIILSRGITDPIKRDAIRFEYEDECKKYIITGRKKRYRNVTKEWLKTKGIKYKRIFFFKGIDKTINTLSNHKTRIINKRKIEIFWEDTELIAWMLAFKCPNCEIRLLVPELLSYTVINVKGKKFTPRCKCECGEELDLNQPLREVKHIGFINGHYKNYKFKKE